jgi:hypothetical protein
MFSVVTAGQLAGCSREPRKCRSTIPAANGCLGGQTRQCCPQYPYAESSGLLCALSSDQGGR